MLRTPQTMAQKIVFYALIVMILINLGFIFGNSLVPPEISAETSDSVADFVTSVLPPDSPVEDFVVNNVRKLAHFCEFSFLGTFTLAFFMIFSANRKKMILPVTVAGQVIGFLDESLQILSGRGPSITDVWIDFAGYVTFGALTCLAVLLAEWLIRLYRARAKSK